MMKPILRRGAAVAATGLVLGSGLAACGGSHSVGGTPVSPSLSGTGTSAAPSNASGQTSGQTSAQESASGQASAPAPGSAVAAADMSQRLQQAAEASHTAHMTMTTSMMGQNITAQGDIQVKPVAEDLTMSAMGMNLQMRYVDDTMYVKIPGMGMGDKWVKATSQELASVSGMSGLSTLTDPLAMFSKIGDAIKSARYVGADSTGKHYVVRVDTTKMLKVMGVRQSQLGEAAGSLPKTITEDLWFDDQGHVDQVRVDLGSSGSATVQMSDFGKPVEVAAPPADQTQDLGSLGSLGGLGSLSSL